MQESNRPEKKTFCKMGKECDVSAVEDAKAWLAVRPNIACNWFHKFVPSCSFAKPQKLATDDLATVYAGSIGLDWGKIASISLGAVLALVLVLRLFLNFRTTPLPR
jgi:hypothetical protein